MSAPRFLVSNDALSGSRTVLTGHELRHLRVRRLRPGTEVILCDGVGTERTGVVVAIERHQAIIQFLPHAASHTESPLSLILAQALVRSDKLDLVIEKATELGVREVLLFASERSLTAVSPNRVARCTRVAASAMKQSQRSAMPHISGPFAFEQLLAQRTHALRLLFWENATSRPLQPLALEMPQASAVLAAVGPEGGFTPAEAEMATAAGFQLVGLGPRVLRTETAAIAALTLCQYLWGDLGGTGVPPR